MEFVRHSYTYHLTRIDHRHNFSVYNTLLHIKSAVGSSSGLGVESLAFFPQLFLSVVAIPLLLAKKDLASTMLAQTFAFVTFNKVCTSQVCLLWLLACFGFADLMVAIVLFVVHGLLAILPSNLIIGATA
jgi:phosphatidylinositol glycan class M